MEGTHRLFVYVMRFMKRKNLTG